MVGREICGPAKKIGSGPSHRLSQAPDRTEGRTRSDEMVNFILSYSRRMAFSAPNRMWISQICWDTVDLYDLGEIEARFARIRSNPTGIRDENLFGLHHQPHPLRSGGHAALRISPEQLGH